MLAIINSAAIAYRGVIPADRWHDPYMSSSELENEIAAGVKFWVAEQNGILSALMGIQDKRDVALRKKTSSSEGTGRFQRDRSRRLWSSGTNDGWKAPPGK